MKNVVFILLFFLLASGSLISCDSDGSAGVNAPNNTNLLEYNDSSASVTDTSTVNTDDTFGTKPQNDGTNDAGSNASGEDTSTTSPDTANTTEPDNVAGLPDASAPDTQTVTPDVQDPTDSGNTKPDSGPDVVTADDIATPQDTADPGEPDLSGPPPQLVDTYSLSIGDWTMAPGKETTKCVIKKLDNKDEIWVSQIRTKLNPGSHHMIVYLTETTQEQTSPFNCTPFTETIAETTFPLMITQIAEETLTFPPHIAFRFKPGQMIRIETHYLNYYPNDIVAHGDVHFDTIAKEDVVSEANMIFYGTPDFKIPAFSEAQTPWMFLDIFAGAKVFAMTGHTHAFGTNVEIKLAQNINDKSGEQIYPPEGTEFSWSEPPVAYFDPPLKFGQGEGFAYRCSWVNTSGKSVGFGESAGEEMCFFWAYYYPSQGYRLCINPGNLFTGLGNQICCPENPICDLVKQYL
ncbi:MAG: hypothetical protein HUU55_23095 [Myxococcales bacterium]|nr:hypothetical protein [Myxococcales bacterium]